MIKKWFRGFGYIFLVVPSLDFMLRVKSSQKLSLPSVPNFKNVDFYSENKAFSAIFHNFGQIGKWVKYGHIIHHWAWNWVQNLILALNGQYGDWYYVKLSDMAENSSFSLLKSTFLKFLLLGTTTLGPNIWFPGITRHVPNWELAWNLPPI